MECAVRTSYRLTPPRKRRNELARYEGSKAPRQNNNRTQPPTSLSPTTARELGGRRCRCRRRHTSATTFLSLFPFHHRPRPAVTGSGVVPGQRRSRQDGTAIITTTSSSSSSSCASNTATAADIPDVFVVARHGIFVAPAYEDAFVVVVVVVRKDPSTADVVDIVVFVVAGATVDGSDVGDDDSGCSRPRVLAGFHGRRARTPLAHTAAAVHSPRPRSTRRRHRRHAPTSAPPRQLASQP